MCIMGGTTHVTISFDMLYVVTFIKDTFNTLIVDLKSFYKNQSFYKNKMIIILKYEEIFI